VLQFAHLFWLLMLPLPWLTARLLGSYRERRLSVRAPFVDRLAQLTGQTPATTVTGQLSPARGQRLLHWVVWILVITALARPQWLDEPLTKTLPMRDLLVAIDLSGSMATADFTNTSGQQVERLTAVKSVLSEFLERREDDRIGLIVFGSAAFVQAPFTADGALLQELLAETEVRMAGPRTMLGDAIGLAITLFDRSDVEERLLILLTDGNDTGSMVPPLRAAEVARDKDIVIYTVGVGDPTAVGEESLDEVVLETVASTTGGGYFHAADGAELETIYAELDRLNPRKVDTLSFRPRQELFHWPLALTVLLTLLYYGSQPLLGRRAKIDAAKQ
jgi:Ca-activated chloride channel family protein